MLKIFENGSHLLIRQEDGNQIYALKTGIGQWTAQTFDAPGKPVLTITNITHNSVRAVYVESGSLVPDQWQLEYSKNSSFTSATTLTGVSPKNITGLDDDTTYYVRVKAAKNGRWSTWSDTKNFKTNKTPTQTGFAWPFPPEDIGTEWEGYPGHRGVDFPKPDGTPIKAAFDGTVTMAGWSTGGWGNVVEIDHGNIGVSGEKLSTLYAHMNSLPPVNVGDTVTKNQVIGYVGTTGLSTGNHLHWETAVGGTFNQINPRVFMNIYGE